MKVSGVLVKGAGFERLHEEVDRVVGDVLWSDLFGRTEVREPREATLEPLLLELVEQSLP